MNVVGDAYGAGIVHHLSRKELEEMDRLRELEEKGYGNNTADAFDLSEIKHHDGDKDL